MTTLIPNKRSRKEVPARRDRGRQLHTTRIGGQCTHRAAAIGLWQSSSLQHRLLDLTAGGDRFVPGLGTTEGVLPLLPDHARPHQAP